VSGAHPDVILKMGVKDVLYRTRHLGWGTDTHRYDTADAVRTEFLPRLRSDGRRVLKQNRGNGGKASGKWKPCRMQTKPFAYFMRSAVADPRRYRSRSLSVD
jgi:hypothetical protein